MSNRRLMLRRQKQGRRLHDQRVPCSGIPVDLDGTDFDLSAILERIAEEQRLRSQQEQGEAHEDSTARAPRARGER